MIQTRLVFALVCALQTVCTSHRQRHPHTARLGVNSRHSSGHSTFDIVTHEAVIAALKEANPCQRVVSIVKLFLQSLTFEIRCCNLQAMSLTNNVGRQGAILSPVLFNLFMRGLTVCQRQIPSVRCTIYADDITLCIQPGHAGGLGCVC